jgi:hypothetical protein
MEALKILIIGFLACYGLWNLMWKFIINPFLELTVKGLKYGNHENKMSENRRTKI